jgi:hypothetical protein
VRQFFEKCKGFSILFPIFALGATAGLLPLRIWQELERIDPATGFWAQWSEAAQGWTNLHFSESRSIPLLYAGLVALLLFPLLAGIALRKRTVLDLGRRPRRAESIFALLVAATLIVDAAAALRFTADVAVGLREGQYLSGMEYASGGALQYYIRTGTFAAAVESLAALGGAALFAQIAFLDWFPQRKKDPSRLLLLMPLLWVICRILRRFARTISYIRVPDLLLDLLLLICLMLFLLPFAQIFSGINGEGKTSRLLGAGLPAAILALLCFVPRVALRLSGVSPLPQDARVEWCDPALALFIAAFLGGRLFLTKRCTAPAAPQTQTAGEATPKEAEEDLAE